MDNAKMKRLKDCELGMLRAFIAVCEQLELKYYLVEGTLLGAVRHGGFIPWDDDVDVAMPRTDYERFLKEAPSYLPSYYFVQSLHSDPEYYFSFAKIRDSRTTFIETALKNRKINHGVYIDVFPLDYVDDNRFRKMLSKIRVVICHLRMWQLLSLQMPRINMLKSIVRSIAGVYAACRYPKLEHAARDRDRLYAAPQSGKLVRNYGSVYGFQEIMPVEWYGDGVELEFEGLMARVPTEYHKWLSQIYGDYMKLPPPEKQIPQHLSEVIDLDKPYTEYIS